MPFRFSLASVLTYREALERREFLALERVQAEISSMERHIEEAEQQRSAMAGGREDELARGIASIHLQAAVDKELFVEQYRDDLNRQRQDLMLKRQELFRAYEEARQKRELMEKLLTRKHEEYTRQQARAEQNTIDDLFLARRSRVE